MEDTAEMTVYLAVFTLLNAVVSLLQLLRVPSTKGMLEICHVSLQLVVRVAMWRVSAVRVSLMGYAYIIALLLQFVQIIFFVPVEFADSPKEVLEQ